MIRLTRLKGEEFIVNASLIKYVEETPDTLITLRDGDKFRVKESHDEVISATIEYIRSTRLLAEFD